MTIKLDNCNICPHECKVNRKIGKKGFCLANNEIKIAKYGMHYYEEPCISGCANCGKEDENSPGSGTIFFSNCNLNCVFCQNYEISQANIGKVISVQKLSDIMIELQQKGAYNINLVTPTIYALQIKEAILIAKEKGLKIPIIYNSSGYKKVETLKLLDGLIDVYLPDFKYFDNNIALEYSKINKYFENASLSISEMYRQVGNPIFDENGFIKKGIIIRHLILPNHTRDSKKILLWIKENLGNEIYISLMAQYFPTNDASKYEKINRKITKKELNIVKKYMYDLGFVNGYVQKLEKNEEQYVPNFDCNI